MISELSFLRFSEVISGLMKNGRKALQTIYESVVASILGETRTSIIKMICPD